MKQQTFSDFEYSNRRRKTKREEFLDSMNEIIPWDRWVEVIRPYYYNNKRGRRPGDLEMMLRIYVMQNWFNLSDDGMEEAINDSYAYAMRNFLGINFLEEQVPDATTILHFRHLLEKHRLGEKIFEDVIERLEKTGLIMHDRSIVDATIIAASSSIKNKDGKRDPEMHQIKKGNQWYHDMKVHAGVGAGSGYVHHQIDKASRHRIGSSLILDHRSVEIGIESDIRFDKQPIDELVVVLYGSTVSTYSENQLAARYGFNKAMDGLPTIKWMDIYASHMHEPLVFALQSGNIQDVVSIHNTLEQLQSIVGDREVILVTDNGSYSYLADTFHPKVN